MDDTPRSSRGVSKDIVHAIAYKSISSPFSRLQLILQNQTYLGQIGLLPEALRNIHSTQISLGVYIYKNEGFIALWKGHTVTVIKTISNTLLDNYVKPYINDIFGSNQSNNPNNPDDNPNQLENSPNPPNEDDNTSRLLPNQPNDNMERTRSFDDPALAKTEVPAFLNMITRHQSDASDNGDNNDNNDNNNNNNSLKISNGTKNVSFLQKCVRVARRQIRHEIYPLLSLAILYPLNVVQTMYWMDLKNAVNVVKSKTNNVNNNNNSNNNSIMQISDGYAFGSYVDFYKSLGGRYDLLYTGLLSAIIGTIVYRQTYFNLHRVIDVLLYKIIGKKPSEYNKLTSKKNKNSGLIMNKYGISSSIDKKREKEIEEQEKIFKIVNQALRGAITTNLAIFAHFPFQVIKYRMMLNNHPNAGIKYNGYKDCILQTYNNHGLKAFFYGATANLIMGVVATVALVTIDMTKVAIIQNKNREMKQQQLQRWGVKY